MDSTDADMMEAEIHSATATPLPQELTSNSEQGGDVVRGLLTLARQHINQGNPSQALQAVVMATRTKGGDEAVFQALNRARELYRNKLQASAAADELASLFAECAIAEALPKSEPLQQNMMEAASSVYSVGVLLVIIAKRNTTHTGVAKTNCIRIWMSCIGWSELQECLPHRIMYRLLVIEFSL
ncbi:hypothetical protein F0562_027638 [Nyssa sinensis]|uniref:Uncharacterized protein n=1 Tax=Nyssa sinensis TaxID=561372 RepID=A0A5J5B7D3_9ASTE|nr:hypothetical protein F0562_027638 [Nyssa sinensis]